VSEKMPQILIRSLCANTPEEEITAGENFSRTDFSAISLSGNMEKLLELIRTIVISHGGPPNTDTVKRQAEKLKETDLVLLVEEIAVVTPRWGSNYLETLEAYKEIKSAEQLRTILQETAQILGEGRETKEQGKLQGVKDAVIHIIEGTAELQNRADPRKRSMSNEEAVDMLQAEYIQRRDQPTMAYGLATGFRAIDESTKGGQLGELWTVAGFVGHGKTTLSLNWARYLAVEGGFNTLIFSLEMGKKQIWRILGTGHSHHPKWEGRKPLDYDKIKSATLSKEEEKFYLNEILPDLKNPMYGRIEVETPVGYTTMAEIRARAELLNRQHPIDMIVVDYLGLVAADKKKKSLSKSERINENFQMAKQMAQEFDHGTGVLVIAPHQINRQGLKKAQENNGIYEVEALSDANEAERSSDVVITVYQDMVFRQKQEGVITVLKNRDGAVVEPFNVYFPAKNRYLADLSTDTGNMTLDKILDA
jgi:replicative DNA helicase